MKDLTLSGNRLFPESGIIDRNETGVPHANRQQLRNQLPKDLRRQRRTKAILPMRLGARQSSDGYVGVRIAGFKIARASIRSFTTAATA